MRYCTRCLYPANHPYGIVFDEQGVCSGCRVHEEKDALDWQERGHLLARVLDRYRARAGSNFDCVIPVTGGGDSFFTVHTVKNVYGLNPLLVAYNHEYNTRVGVRNLANLATVFDCDLLTSTLSPSFLQRLTRHTLKKLGTMYWHVLAGQLTFPVQVAVKFKVPLVVWGVHGFSDQVGMFSHLDEVEMTEKCRKEHALMGCSAEALIDETAEVSRHDMQPFIYPYDNELEQVGVRGVYLSNYLRWDAKAQHEQMIATYGYEAARQERTFNTYEDVHCLHSAGLHDYIKFLKYGYSKVTDHASREIRLRRLTREQGMALVQEYTHKQPEDLGVFLEWVGMNEADFWRCVIDRRDPAIWRRQGDDYVLLDQVDRHASDPGVDAVRLPIVGPCDYRVTPRHEPESPDDKRYLLMGRGYIDRYNYGAVLDQPAGGAVTPRIWKRPPLGIPE